MTPPTIEQAKTIAYANRAIATIIIQIGGGQIGYASYGVSRAMCDAAKDLVNNIHLAIEDEVVEIPSALTHGLD
jgi:hypothetical protein